MNFFEIIKFRKGEIIALVGGGGKTTLMYALAREALQHGFKTVITTTTKIFYPDDPGLEVILAQNSIELLEAVNKKLANLSQVVAGFGLTQDNKVLGLDKSLIPMFLETGADLVIVEADGSSRKPFKAPANHEPVIPEAATMVIPVAGIDCLGQPLSPLYVHRPEIVAKLTGTALGDKITPEVVATVLTHPKGFRKNIPREAQWIPFINKVASPLAHKQAQEIALKVTQSVPCKVLLGAALQADPIKEVFSATS